MRHFKSLIILISILLLIQSYGIAQQNNYGVILKNTELNNDVEPLVKFLPFSSKKCKEGDNHRPLAFGISLSALVYQQEFISSNLKISATNNLGIEFNAKGDSVSQNTTAGQFNAYIKPSIWLFPFLNVYGIFGYTSGRIKPDLYIDGISVEDESGLISFPIDTVFILDDEITYVGSTFGIGANFSIGYKNFFINVDYNYTTTQPSDLEGKLHNHYASPKIGYIISPKNKKINVSIWAGALYMSNNQSFKGELTVAEIAPELVPIFGEYADYTGSIEAKNNWNFVFGSGIYINSQHNIFIELGLINRSQASLGYSFMF